MSHRCGTGKEEEEKGEADVHEAKEKLVALKVMARQRNVSTSHAQLGLEVEEGTTGRFAPVPATSHLDA